MKTRHLLMTLGLALASWLALFGDKSPSSNIAEPVARDSAKEKSSPVKARIPQVRHDSAQNGSHSIAILKLQPRQSLMGGSRQSTGAGLFGSKSWTPPPPPAPKPPPPPPPMAPPLPFTFIGKKFEGGRWEIYVMRGEQTYIVHENDVLDNSYHIDSIKPPILTMTYLPLQQVQTLTIGGAD